MPYRIWESWKATYYANFYEINEIAFSEKNQIETFLRYLKRENLSQKMNLFLSLSQAI